MQRKQVQRAVGRDAGQREPVRVRGEGQQLRPEVFQEGNAAPVRLLRTRRRHRRVGGGIAVEGDAQAAGGAAEFGTREADAADPQPFVVGPQHEARGLLASHEVRDQGHAFGRRVAAQQLPG